LSEGGGGGCSTAPKSASKEEIDRITRVVLAVLNAEEAQRSEPRSGVARLRDFFLGNWQLTALLLSAAVLAGASLIYGASPFHYFKELAVSDRELDAKERQFAYEQSMAKKHIALGLALLDQGRFKDSASAFETALSLDEHSVDARLGKFKAEFFAPSSEKQFDPAVIEQRIETVYTNSKTGDIEDPHALAALGDLMFATGRTDEARSYYKRAIDARPQLAHAHAKLAEIAFEESNFVAAADAMQKAYDLAKSNPDYRTNLASALLYAGKYDDAINRYQEIFRIDQEKLSPYLECALAYRLEGEFQKSLTIIEYALDSFDKVLKLPKNSSSDWLFIVNGTRYYLTNSDEKRGYAYRTAELSAYLAGNTAEQKRLNEGDYGPDLPVPQAIRDAIGAELTELHQRQPAISSALDAYYRDSAFLHRQN
jgi:tetratricopeptide (TPR) repeat protein